MKKQILEMTNTCFFLEIENTGVVLNLNQCHKASYHFTNVKQTSLNMSASILPRKCPPPQKIKPVLHTSVYKFGMYDVRSILELL